MRLWGFAVLGLWRSQKTGEEALYDLTSEVRERTKISHNRDLEWETVG
jgi:hypothetical protein